MANYSSFPGPLGQIVYGFICGGDDSDPAQDHSGNQRFMSHDASSAGCNIEDMPFNPRSVSGTQVAQQLFGGVLDPGTPVMMIKSLGNPHGVILGQLNSLFNGESGSGGSSLLSGNKHFQEMKNRKLNVSGPPRVKETTDADGVKIRKVEETGEMHHLGLLEGLPIHGALPNMTGFRQPELPNIPTAKQTNDGMMMMEQMEQMLGQIMSLGQMFAGLAGNRGAGGGGGGLPNGFASGNPDNTIFTYNSNTSNTTTQTEEINNFPYGGSEYYSANNRLISIQNRTPSEIGLAIGNLAKIIQGLEVSDGVSFFTGGVVHEETYLQNAENLLCECKSIDDLMSVLSRLQFDEELFGREKLADVRVTVQTSYGPTESVVDYTGNVYVVYKESVLQEIESFSQEISSNIASPAIGLVPDDFVPPTAPSFPPNQGGGGAGGGGSPVDIAGLMSMFSRSAQTMQEMMKRLHPEGEKNARNLYKKVNNGEESKKLFEINKKTLNNGDPFEGGDYSKSSNFRVEFLE